MSSIKSRSGTLQIVLLYSPVLIAILVMLPRLLSPQFGLLDDGKSIITSQDISRGEWDFRFDSTDARFRPLYWLSFALPYVIVGEQPIWFFLVNAFVLCLTIIAMIAFLQRLSVKPWQAWLAGIFFVLSGAIIENFYTLSKGEWLQVMFIASSLFVAALYSSASVLLRKFLVVSSASLLLFCAMLSKETSVVMLPVSAVWAALGWFWARRAKTNVQTWRIPYLISSVGAVSVYFVSRFIFILSAASTSGYTERYIFTVSQFVTSAIRWSGWLVRDYFYLAAIMLLVFILLISRRGFTQKQLAVDMLVWMAAWIVVYLPWNFMTEYYMLPFAFGAAIFAGSVLGDLSIWRVRLTRLIGVLSIALIVITLMNNYTSARIQLTVDSINDQFMRLVSSLPPQSTVLINIQSQNEYSDQIPLQLDARFGRDDLTIELFDSKGGIPKTCRPGYCFLVTPFVENQPLMTVRMGVFEPTQEDWNDDLQMYLKNLPGWEKDQVLIDSFQMLSVDFPRLFCGFIETRAFCATPSPFLDTRQFQYGWTVFKLED